ncbi:prefoldin subunit 2 [Leguminivora glycinivorella]|uniref:prefoldin subunit 2 n=1 Tax=Leguminivora glycinivorella TaxID=1035111 RepID=UPI00200D98E4|nr:prefoldin subunit 2 [Leguminivora glycinivorella]
MAKPANKGGKKSSEEVFTGFQTLRAEQRQLANKISELEMDLNEHKIVVETLKGVEEERRCFRMVGGVLLERTAGAALAELEANLQRLPHALAALNQQLANKGQEINAYIETHDIRLQRGATTAPAPPPEAAPSQQNNVLVASG